MIYNKQVLPETDDGALKYAGQNKEGIVILSIVRNVFQIVQT